MPFLDFWNTLNAKARGDLAAACGTTRAYLSKLAHGHRYPSVDMMDKVAKATLGRVPRESWPVREVA